MGSIRRPIALRADDLLDDLALTGNGVFLLEKTCYMHAICKVDIRYIIAQTMNNRVMSFDYIGDNYCKFEYTGEAQHNPLFAN